MAYKLYYIWLKCEEPEIGAVTALMIDYDYECIGLVMGEPGYWYVGFDTDSDACFWAAWKKQ